jgi:hypothetical protein
MARIGNYQKAKFIVKTLNAAEVSSGIVRLPILQKVSNSGTDLDYVYQIRTANGLEKTTAATSQYIKASGLLNIYAGTSPFATGDKLTVKCTFA